MQNFIVNLAFPLRYFCIISIFLLCFTDRANSLNEESASALKKLGQEVKMYTLENGLRVILYRRGTAPVFAGMVAVRVGGTDEIVGNTGISHMLEHMAFKGTPDIGTKDYKKEQKLLEQLEVLETKISLGQKLSQTESQTREQINKELKELWILGDFNSQYDKRGANDMNATTDKELTKYFVNLPRSEFEFWCWMESERILSPVMRQFYQERDVVMEERRMRFEDDPQGKLYEMLLGVAYSKHPYRNPVIGYDFDIKRLTATMVADFHKEYYVPSNIVVSVVGDINVETDIKTIEKYFGRLPAREAPSHPTIVEPKQAGERRLTLETTAAPQLFVAYHKPNYPHPDDAPLSVMAEILAGSNVSPLYTELVKIRRLASDIGHDEAPGYAYPNMLMFISAANSPHSNTDILNAFDDVLAKFKANKIDPKLLLMAKKQTAMQYLAHLKSNMSLAQDLASAELLYGDWKSSIEWFDQMMNVSAEDVSRVAKQYLNNSNRTIGMIETARKTSAEGKK